jgi:protein-S-isoprenylcysteine O-methyltransferase Ste14
MNIFSITGKIDFVVYCWGFFVLAGLIASALSTKSVKERQSRAGRMATLGLTVVTFSLLAGIINLYGLNTRILPDTPALRIIGDVVTFAGLVTAIWARFSLGGNWSATITFKEGHELIERGPYRFVRHPMYTGVLLMILGTAVFAGRISGFAALVIFFFTILQKFQQEEALLMKHFPDAYRQYMSRTKALVPFLF